MSTVLFGSDGVVKLADFGLGKLLDKNQIFTRSLVGVSLSVAPRVRFVLCRY
jgi:serine/threonine protein kinase